MGLKENSFYKERDRYMEIEREREEGEKEIDKERELSKVKLTQGILKIKLDGTVLQRCI